MKSNKITPERDNLFYLLIETVEGSATKLLLFPKTKKGFAAVLSTFDVILAKNGYTHDDVYIPDGAIQAFDGPAGYRLEIIVIEKQKVK